MANIDVTVANTLISVASTLSNISVSEGTNFITNVSTIQSNISVNSTTSNITVGTGGLVSNATIRSALSAETLGVGLLAANLDYNSGTGVFTLTPPSVAEVLSLIGNTSPILYDVNTGIIGFDTSAISTETYYNSGNGSGNVTLDYNNANTQRVTLTGDITGIAINNINAGETFTIILTQDIFGGRTLDTTTYASNWTNWDFIADATDIDIGIGQESILNIIYDGTTYYASIVRMNTTINTDYVDQANTSINRYLRAEDYGPSQLLMTNYLGITNGRSASGITANTNGSAFAVQQPGIAVPGEVGFNFVIDHDNSSTANKLRTGAAQGNVVFPGVTNIILGDIDTTDSQPFYKDAAGTITRTGTASIPQFGIAGVNILTQARSNSDFYSKASFGFMTNGAGVGGAYGGNVDTLYIVFPDTETTSGPAANTNGALIITDGSDRQLAYTNIPPHMKIQSAGEDTTAANIRVSIATGAYDSSNQLLVAGNIGATGTITANYFVGDGGGLSNVSASANLALNTTDELTEGNVNLYYTSDRANIAIAEYQGDIDTAGEITGGYFIGDGGGLSNVTANANLALSTTDDLTEGNVNLYFTTDRANTAINNYTGNFSNATIITPNKITAANITLIKSGKSVIIDPNFAAGNITYNRISSSNDPLYLFTNGYDLNFFAGYASLSDTSNITFTAPQDIKLTSETGRIILRSQELTFPYANTNTTVDVIGNINVSNTATAAYFIGDGSSLTNSLVNYTTDDLTEGNVNLYWTTDRGNSMVEAFQGDIDTVGTITATAFIGDGSDLTSVRAETITEKVKNKSGGTLPKGTPVYATGNVVADVLEVAACDAGDTAKMPCIGVLSTALDDDEEGTAILAGRISGVDTSAFVPGDQIYVAIGGGYANTSPAGESNVVQFLGTVTRVDASQGGGIVHVSEPRDTDALNSGNIFIGSGANRTTTATLNTSIVPESGNLYFTTDRANTAIDNYTGNFANASIATTNTSLLGNITVRNSANASQNVTFLAGQTLFGSIFNSITSRNGIFNIQSSGFDLQFNAGANFLGQTSNVRFLAPRNIDLISEAGQITLRGQGNPPTLANANTFVQVLGILDVSNSISATTITAGNITLTKFNETTQSLGNVSGDISANLDVSNGTIFTLTTNGNITVNSLTNAVAGTSATLVITQGSGTDTLTSTMKFAGNVRTLSNTVGAIDVISVFYDGTNYLASLSTGYV